MKVKYSIDTSHNIVYDNDGVPHYETINENFTGEIVGVIDKNGIKFIIVNDSNNKFDVVDIDKCYKI